MRVCVCARARARVCVFALDKSRLLFFAGIFFFLNSFSGVVNQYRLRQIKTPFLSWSFFYLFFIFLGGESIPPCTNQDHHRTDFHKQKTEERTSLCDFLNDAKRKILCE